MRVRKRGNCKRGGIAEQVYIKTGLMLIEFCEIKKLPYRTILNGYISKRTEKVLKEHRIKVV